MKTPQTSMLICSLILTAANALGADPTHPTFRAMKHGVNAQLSAATYATADQVPSSIFFQPKAVDGFAADASHLAGARTMIREAVRGTLRDLGPEAAARELRSSLVDWNASGRHVQQTSYAAPDGSTFVFLAYTLYWGPEGSPNVSNTLEVFRTREGAEAVAVATFRDILPQSELAVDVLRDGDSLLLLAHGNVVELSNTQHLGVYLLNLAGTATLIPQWDRTLKGAEIQIAENRGSFSLKSDETLGKESHEWVPMKRNQTCSPKNGRWTCH